MRFLLTMCVLAVGVPFWVTPVLGETAVFPSFYKQRELVASIFFEDGKSELSDDAIRELESILSHIREAGSATRMIRVEGFSGSDEFDEYNFRLSLNRANAVAMFFEKNGVPCQVGANEFEQVSISQDGSGNTPRVEIVSYPQMFLLDYAGTHRIDIDEVKLQ